MAKVFSITLLYFTTLLIFNFSEATIIADHSVIGEFNLIPDSVLNQVKTEFNIFYGHTSHGSQIITGMSMLRDENPIYDFNNGDGTLAISEYGDDLGADGDTSWVPITRDVLNQPGNEINMVVWSWCGGVSWTSEANIGVYLDAFAQLEQEFPNVIFIYMTGHLDGSGIDGNLHLRNNQIRQYCLEHDKILFDFADIESFDPDGGYYPDGTDACEWCYNWCASHTCPSCGDCAHSHCFNCYQKGKVFWWLLARNSGWNAVSAGCGDINSDGLLNILDISFLINYLYKNGPAPADINNADVNNSGNLNILDVSSLIKYLYKSGPALNCP
ncbi:conserved hypothetical protein [Candidatus Zixiibacteriota bacterium]|nr:conserved hypothetical protein [candidate division Zixibacteria bacterium]